MSIMSIENSRENKYYCEMEEREEYERKIYLETLDELTVNFNVVDISGDFSSIKFTPNLWTNLSDLEEILAIMRVAKRKLRQNGENNE